MSRAEGNDEIVDLSEQWAPYRRWFDSLRPGADTVITFNYDRALNILSEYGRRRSPAKDVFASPAWHSTDYIEKHADSVVPMFHLHGHVGWKRNVDGKIVRVEPRDPNGVFRDLATAHLDPVQAVIGVPGQDKRTLPTGLLERMWVLAMEAIQLRVSRHRDHRFRRMVITRFAPS